MSARRPTRKIHTGIPGGAASVVGWGGFTIVELLIVIAIMLTVSAIAIPSLMGSLAEAKYARAVVDLRTIGDETMGYYLQYGTMPLTLSDISMDQQRDPWGNPYQYTDFATLKGNGNGGMRKDRFQVPINTYCDLYSMGPDGRSQLPLTANYSQDDVIWANDGDYIGWAANY